jgi:hypothetical protein
VSIVTAHCIVMCPNFCCFPCSDNGCLHAAGMNSKCSMVQLDGQLVHYLVMLRGRTANV